MVFDHSTLLTYLNNEIFYDLCFPKETACSSVQSKYVLFNVYEQIPASNFERSRLRGKI